MQCDIPRPNHLRGYVFTIHNLLGKYSHFSASIFYSHPWGDGSDIEKVIFDDDTIYHNWEAANSIKYHRFLSAGSHSVHLQITTDGIVYDMVTPILVN